MCILCVLEKASEYCKYSLQALCAKHATNGAPYVDADAVTAVDRADAM